MARLPRAMYFAYDAGMSSRMLRRIAPSARFATTAHLDLYRVQYCMRGNDGSAKCSIVADDRGFALGVVYSVAVDDIDRIEMKDPGYQRLDDIVVVGEAGPLKVHSIVARPAFLRPTLWPYTWYRTHVLAGALEHKLPERYIREFLARRSIDDPDKKRNARELKVYTPRMLVEVANIG